ncbi:uncharacterized protein LOC9633549 isoform X2 [Selaginella moellendorffii]|uniref:uncharacterized protein LOC9633549 isoform X2 n=1 Tax=Selaginella moellendorffii TaxID=88036 RepID=UPI000D1C449B|nr:uncharacterized protein LOC9633549 isoform X2 [Selaginella moellendorffii]|eukprot:XP_024529647.1 uncharacterized protein LOC9633549 isoform X2 [Selaginella moellendorffii]
MEIASHGNDPSAWIHLGLVPPLSPEAMYVLHMATSLRAWNQCSCNSLALRPMGIELYCLDREGGSRLQFDIQVWSLDHTSLPHSLLFVSMPPLIIAVLSWLRCKPLSKGENAGVFLGFAGVLIIAFASKSDGDKGITFLGDLMAFLAAVAFVGYMFAGNNLRSWMPLYLYAFPVTAGGALILGIACEFMENYHSRSWKIGGPFAWTRRGFWAPTLFLAIGPGLIGHTGLNYVVKYTGPLIISMAVTLEPVIGSLIGWGIHVSSAPGVFTCVGGALLIFGTLVVNYANGRATKKKLEAEQARQQELPQNDSSIDAGPAPASQHQSHQAPQHEQELANV